MKYKIFEKLKSLTLNGEVNIQLLEESVEAAVNYIVTERSVVGLRLFSAIFNLHISKGHKYSFFQYSNLESLQQLFEKDPSDFFVIFFYALSKYCEGDKKRAEQLFIRLEKSGWKNRKLATEMNTKLLVKRG